MNFFKQIKLLKQKTWFDWLKIIIAIDIASAGIGLILNIPIHAIAYLLGFFTRIIFGVLYIGFATFLIKEVFTNSHHTRIKQKDKIETLVRRHSEQSISFMKKIILVVEEKTDRLMYHIDALLDEIENFIKEEWKHIRRK